MERATLDAIDGAAADGEQAAVATAVRTLGAAFVWCACRKLEFVSEQQKPSSGLGTLLLG